MKNKVEKLLSVLLIWIPTFFSIYKTKFLFDEKLKIQMIFIPIVFSIFAVFCISMSSKLKNTNKLPSILYYVICISIPLFFSINQFKIIFKIDGAKELLLLKSNILMGLLFIVIGNYIPKMQFSRFVGLKFWWLKDRQDVWKKTHLLAGYLWVIAGMIMIMAENPNSLWIIGIYFMLLYFIPLLYAIFLCAFTKNRFSK